MIVNPIAGNGRAKAIGAQVSKYLNDRSIEHRVFYTEYKRHATSLAHQAVKENIETVLSVGGDGTTFEIASALVNSNTALGIIPAGTGNDFIKSINLPKDPIEALKKILTLKARPLDIGKANHNYFLNVCGIGIDTLVLEYSINAKKIVKGILPYFYSLLLAIFRYKAQNIKIKIDDKILEGKFLLCVIANGKYFGGGIPIAPTASVDDSYFDVILVDNVNRFRIPFYLFGLMRKKVLKYKITRHFRTKNISIEGKNISIEEDGEVSKTNFVNFSILPTALKVYW